EAELEKANAELQERVAERQRAIEEERAISREALAAAVVREVESVNAQAGNPVDHEVAFLGRVIVQEGAKVTKTVINKVQREGDKELAAFDKETEKLKQAEQIAADGALDDAKASVYDELHPLQEKERQVREEVEAQYQERIKDLEDLVDPVRDD